MKVILVGVLLIASAGLAAAQDVQPTGRRIGVIARSTTGATVEFDAVGGRENGVYVEKRDHHDWRPVVTADDATLEKTEVKLGANARLILPPRIKTTN